ncbi:ABC transporter ATP-binding protein [Pseudomonas gingeri]|uniref:Spermidine/putrescine import ATP-binding protein PotA n=1 Tax=Pseudomonas gingeri TaxID=117681 RepID=A0A7Y7XB32_9PSED|nr:ABC transporter ATP-binding protein [Pseudomonas gingeri]NWA28158.1 ABC transporter ATP-binding protein [Pseudomonas gingeri]NWB95487.1 ABC transporter ATP-binding protein [Pseudomonas gingeri]NWD66631.1 ABC transporter ATP-binding protein [Pseudomonas gingeri]
MRIEPFVSFRNVQKTYDGEHLVVKNFNLEIEQGEFVTMLGPSGSGKTTCLMMLAGFETVTHGQICIDGQSVNDIAPQKRGIGMVFQNYALFPHMTIEENLAFPLKVRNLSRDEIETRVRTSLDLVALGQFAKRMPAQLSGGQKQRVALARALIFEPRLVLMDEPLGALDKQLREQMQYEIKRLSKQLGITVVYVTHDQTEALTMSDRIAVFNDGVVQQLANPADLYEQPATAFVASFIGENNRLMGQVVERQDRYCKVQVGQHLVKALAVNIHAGGHATTLSIRPERVKISPQPGEFDNQMPASIEEIIYHGDHLRARLKLADNDAFIVKMVNAAGHPTPVAGARINVGWSADDCRALDA